MGRGSGDEKESAVKAATPPESTDPAIDGSSTRIASRLSSAASNDNNRSGENVIHHSSISSSDAGSLAAIVERFSTSYKEASPETRLGSQDDFWDLYELTGRLLGFGGFALVSTSAVC